MSPVTTTFELKPMRVRNIFICSGVVFCASSRMMKLSLSVRPRMNASGATSTVPRSSRRCAPSGSTMSYERVVQRAQVRVDLGHQVAGQEAQTLTCFDGGPREDDALDLLALQRLHRHGHREPALARAGRADAERDDVLADGVDVALLAAALRADAATARRSQHLGRQHLGRSFVGLDHVDAARHRGRLEHVALLQQRDELLEEPTDLLGVLTVDGDLVAAHVNGRVGERGLDESQQLVLGSEQAHHQVVPGHVDLHLRGGHEF